MKKNYTFVKILFIGLFAFSCLSMFAQNPFTTSWPLQNDGIALTSGAITAQPVSSSNNFEFSNFTGANFVTSTWNPNATNKYIEFQIIPNANTTVNISSLSYKTHFQSLSTGIFSTIYYSYDNFVTSHYLTFNNAPATGSNGTYQSDFSISNLTLSSNQPISFRIVADSNASNPPPFEFVMSDFQLVGTTSSLCSTPVFTIQPYPNNQVVCANGINSIAIISQAINVSHYQWLHNGSGLVGQNGPELHIFNIAPSDSGTYTVFAINSCDEIVASNSVTVTVNPTTTFFLDNDADGFGDAGISFESCTPVSGFTTNNLDCNDNQITYLDNDLDGFGSTVLAPCGVAFNTDCNDNNATIYLGAIEICGDGLDNNCNGIIDENCLPANQTALQNAQCGTTLATINQSIFAQWVAGAQMYRFRVTDVTTNQVQTIDRVLRVFNFTQLGAYAYGRTYNVEVAAKVANVFQPYGYACSITTPTPSTKLQSSQCGITLSSFNTVLYVNTVQYAAGYRFKLTNTTTNQVYLFDRSLRDFRVTSLPRIYQATYSVEIAVKNTDGTYLPYGESCSIQMPLVPIPSIVNCGVITNNQIWVNSVPEATLYHFELVHEYYYTTGWSDFYYQFTSSSPGVSVLGYYNPYHTFYGRVRAEINGVLGAFSDFCIIPGNGQGVPDARFNQNERTFEITATPNPFDNQFTLSNDSPSTKEDVAIKVFDVLGQLIEQKTYSEMDNITLGRNYESGVYLVTITQGTAQKTIRMIKR